MPRAKSPSEPPPLTRSRISTFLLLLLTAVTVVTCLIITAPFLAALSWALALAIVTHPVHNWINRRIRKPNLAAGLAVALITVAILAPMVFVVRQVGKEASQGLERIQGGLKAGELEKSLEQNPKTAGAYRWINDIIDVEREIEDLGESLQQHLGKWIRGTVWTVTQSLITVFFLFYLFRDREEALQSLRSLLPLSERETDEVLDQVRGMIRATIYGTLFVAAVQGALGGLMFWILNLPAPLIWGVVMGLLAIIPVLGAFVIWVPAAIALALQGNWGKAVILTLWGTFVVGLIDNLLYPILVGKEVRLHTVPVFIAIVGGLFVFGASGLVLGPMALAIAVALIDVLRRRTIADRSAQEPT